MLTATRNPKGQSLASDNLGQVPAGSLIIFPTCLCGFQMGLPMEASGLYDIVPNTNVGYDLAKSPDACPRLGYLYLLEVHRLADELIVLGQLLARGQLDEHLAELTSTTTVRQNMAHVTPRLPFWGGLHPPPLRTERMRS